MEASTDGSGGSSSSSSSSGLRRVQVIVRVRPLQSGEGSGGDAAVQVLPPDGVEVRLRRGGSGGGGAGGSYGSHFDCVLGPECSQAEVYAPMAGAMRASARGINATVFAYGQTGTGKTYSMFGPATDDARRYVLRVRKRRRAVLAHTYMSTPTHPSLQRHH